LSNGEKIENPRFLRQSDRRLKTAQRAVSRKNRGGNNRRKAVLVLKKRHLKIKRQRLDFLHKTARQLVCDYDEIAVEKLNISGMVKNHRLAKSIADASWATFLQILECKAENAGKRVWKVDARNTSQNCSNCGVTVKKNLSQRKHKCASCGFEAHRDLNAAINIQARAVPLGMSAVRLADEPRISR
ncbi:MAG TPA: RNA-guided endonuclease TnpB family protein, partial [Pyrinomonadaceae bacterium]